MGLIVCSVGGGTCSDDVTATKAQVLDGYTAVTSDSDDEPIEGTLPLNKVLADAGGTLPLNKVLANYGGTLPLDNVLADAGGTMINNNAWTSNPSSKGNVSIPKGFHNGNGYVNCNGAFDAGIIAGRNNRRTASISSHSYCASWGVDNDDGTQSFTIPSNAINCKVYYAGYSGNLSGAKTGFICQISENGVVKDSRDGGQGYAIRGTMQNKSFTASGGDVISVYSYCSEVSTFSGIDAVIVYDLP